MGALDPDGALTKPRSLQRTQTHPRVAQQRTRSPSVFPGMKFEMRTLIFFSRRSAGVFFGACRAGCIFHGKAPREPRVDNFEYSRVELGPNIWRRPPCQEVRRKGTDCCFFADIVSAKLANCYEERIIKKKKSVKSPFCEILKDIVGGGGEKNLKKKKVFVGFVLIRFARSFGACFLMCCSFFFSSTSCLLIRFLFAAVLVSTVTRVDQSAPTGPPKKVTFD